MSVNAGRIGLLVAALRSGEYKKGRSVLHRTEDVRGEYETHDADTWCCLGVATDLAVKFGLEVPVATSYDGSHEVYGVEKNGTSLCAVVREWYGLESSNPDLLLKDSVPSRRHKTNAVELNDHGFVKDGDQSYSEVDFEVIADAFENTFLGEE